MTDGAELLADRYSPRDAGPRPTVLIRSPYGRRGVYGLLYGALFAQQGLQTVIQSTRGTFGSGGEFAPFDERDDGLATIEWVHRQPWHEGPLGMAGASYLGLTQWAVAAAAGEALAAIAPVMTASNFHGATNGGGLALESMAAWHAMVSQQQQPFAPLQMAVALTRLRLNFDHLPLSELDTRFAGRELPLFREALEHADRSDDYWTARDYGARIEDVEAAVLLVAGWHDIFTPWQLDDYARLRAAGKRPRLVVGPWTHTSQGMWAASTRESIRWLRAHLLGDEMPGSHVRVYVGGAGEWRNLRDWPPPEATEQTLFLGGGGTLSAEPDPHAEPDRYHYNPADPTPSHGGPVLLARQPVVNNGALERRADVLTYTTAPLHRAVEVIGPVRVRLFVSSSLGYFDVFARLCDVDRWQTSRNVCDALERASTERDRVVEIAFDLWPAAHRFERGHRIRLQVSSGAHPRYARNLGTGEPLPTSTRLVASEQAVHHDAAHPSAAMLSIVPS